LALLANLIDILLILGVKCQIWPILVLALLFIRLMKNPDFLYAIAELVVTYAHKI